MSNGYDGSMMNGLQTLDQWRNYFGNPQGSTLGLFNAIQVSQPLHSTALSLTKCSYRTLARSSPCLWLLSSTIDSVDDGRSSSGV